MSNRMNRRIERLEEGNQPEPSIIVARHGYTEPKPGQVVIGNGYFVSEWPPKTKKTKGKSNE